MPVAGILVALMCVILAAFGSSLELQVNHCKLYPTSNNLKLRFDVTVYKVHLIIRSS